MAAALERTGVIVDDASGETFIPASRRPDGTWRKPRRVKDGFVPQEEMPVYENRGVQWLKSKPSLPPGMAVAESETPKPKLDQTNAPMSKSAKKNAKRKEKKNKANPESVQSIEKVSNSLANAKISSGQSKASTETNSQSEPGQTESTEKQEVVKKLRKLRKTLKQIEDLESRIKSGELKNPEKEQLQKVLKKKSLVDEIEDLELELDDL